MPDSQHSPLGARGFQEEELQQLAAAVEGVDEVEKAWAAVEALDAASQEEVPACELW